MRRTHENLVSWGAMPQRSLRILQWISSTPWIGGCTACTKQFKVPTTAMNKAEDAFFNLQQQFDLHKCEAGPIGLVPAS
jgi:hypothetical protein